MAFTIKQIKALLSNAGVAQENLTAVAEDICGRHNTDLEAIKEERDTALDKAKTFAEVKKELDELKAANGKDSFKVKYEAIKEEFEAYKADIEKSKTVAEKQNAYKEILKELKVSDKIIDKVVKLANLDDEEFKDGKFTNASKIKEALGEEWKDFIVKEGTKGAKVDNPPAGGDGKKTREEIYKKDDNGRYIMSAAERQEALAKLAENSD